jgi:hypothetical protein
MHKELAKNLQALVRNKQAWEALEDYLQELAQMTHRELVEGTSIQELHQAQGKASLLETLLKLSETVEDGRNQYDEEDEEKSMREIDELYHGIVDEERE